MAREKGLNFMKYVLERPVEIDIYNQNAEIIIDEGIKYLIDSKGPTYNKDEILRFEIDGITIRVDANSDLRKIWWEYFLIKCNRILRPNGVVPYPKKLDNCTQVLEAIHWTGRNKFKSADEAIADYEQSYSAVK